MFFLLPSPRSAMRATIVFALAMFASTAAAESGGFKVREGYLSASVRDLADSHGWSLVWSASEDRVISHSFTIANDSLQGALESLFSMYGGQFVADLYRGNRVVVVNTPPPRVDVAFPGVEGTDLAQHSSEVESFPEESGSDDREATTPLVAAYDATGSDQATSPPATGNENERVAIESP